VEYNGGVQDMRMINARVWWGERVRTAGISDLENVVGIRSLLSAVTRFFEDTAHCIANGDFPLVSLWLL